MDDVEDKAVDKGLSMSNHRCEFTDSWALNRLLREMVIFSFFIVLGRNDSNQSVLPPKENCRQESTDDVAETPTLWFSKKRNNVSQTDSFHYSFTIMLLHKCFLPSTRTNKSNTSYVPVHIADIERILPPSKIISFHADSIESENGAHHGRLLKQPFYQMETLPSSPIKTSYSSSSLALRYHDDSGVWRISSAPAAGNKCVSKGESPYLSQNHALPVFVPQALPSVLEAASPKVRCNTPRQFDLDSSSSCSFHEIPLRSPVNESTHIKRSSTNEFQISFADIVDSNKTSVFHHGLDDNKVDEPTRSPSLLEATTPLKSNTTNQEGTPNNPGLIKKLDPTMGNPNMSSVIFVPNIKATSIVFDKDPQDCWVPPFLRAWCAPKSSGCAPTYNHEFVDQILMSSGKQYHRDRGVWYLVLEPDHDTFASLEDDEECSGTINSSYCSFDSVETKHETEFYGVLLNLLRSSSHINKM